MKFELFIARRLNSSRENKNTISKPIISIAIVGIALGLAVIIISIAVVTGFKEQIRNKVIGFGSHIQIVNYDSNNSFETNPIVKNDTVLQKINTIEGVKHVQTFATKPGIIKTKDNIQGVVLKGVGPRFNWDFFEQNMVKGSTFQISDDSTTNKIIISQTIADLLKLETGQDIAMFFVQDPPRLRRFTISGIYNTSLKELDKLFVLCDIKHIQKLNNWTDNKISGYEILISDFERLQNTYEKVNDKVGFSFDKRSAQLRVIPIDHKYPQIFDWLNLLDLNVRIILILMLVVAGINMISGLLIIILERTNMIGLLKAMGSENFKIRNIFLYQAGFVILKGLFWGNIIGIAIGLIQKNFQIITLNPATYYLTVVPINLNIIHIIGLNIGMLIIVLVMLLLPSLIISRISPMKTIRFE